MADFLDQIPKLLMARRKSATATAAIHGTVLRTIAAHFRNHLHEAVVNGCTFPDRPIALSPRNTGLLNFGMTPEQFRDELLWADSGGVPPETSTLKPADEKALAAALDRVAVAYGDDHARTRVYNLEPWLQEIYRDRLDLDYTGELQRRIEQLEHDMDAVPRGLRAAGLPTALSDEVMAAFNQFKTISEAAHRLEREKQSFVDRRQFAIIVGQIETALNHATGKLGPASSRNPIHELFDFWKNANFETMQLANTLRAVWDGTRLDERIGELARILDAVVDAALRAGDDAVPPGPSCPLLAIEETGGVLDRAAAASAFALVDEIDAVFGHDPKSIAGELRRYGPLTLLIVPGAGRARYAVELRQALVKADEDAHRGVVSAPTERELDMERRLRYPLNLVLLPLMPRAPDGLAAAMLEGWLEWKSAARSRTFKALLADLRKNLPEVLEGPADRGAAPPNHARRTLAKRLAVFGEWMRSGRAPAPEEDPGHEPFAAWACARIPTPELLVPLRYRPTVEAFRTFSEKKRATAWRRYLGPCYDLDRRMLALELLRRDWEGFASVLKWLPPAWRRHPLVERARADLRGDDRFGDRDRKIETGLRKFMEEDPDLKIALMTMETTLAVELDALRSRHESLGRRFEYDRVIGDVLQRLDTQLRSQRREVAGRLDGYLIALLHAVDGNDDAAIAMGVECLTHAARPAAPETPEMPEVAEVVTEAWFTKHFPTRAAPFTRRPVAGEEGASGTECMDYLYFNLGRLYQRTGRPYEALLCFREFINHAPARGWYFYGQRARIEFETLRKAYMADPDETS